MSLVSQKLSELQRFSKVKVRQNLRTSKFLNLNISVNFWDMIFWMFVHIAIRNKHTKFCVNQKTFTYIFRGGHFMTKKNIKSNAMWKHSCGFQGEKSKPARKHQQVLPTNSIERSQVILSIEKYTRHEIKVSPLH